MKSQKSKNLEKDSKKELNSEDMRKKLLGYEVKRWQESRGKFVEFDIKTMNKYKKYYDDIAEINPNPDNDGMGVDQLEEPFISLGLAYTKEEVENLISSVDDDDSGKIEFEEFLRIIHNKSKKKAKGNEKITNFFKELASNNISSETDLHHFSFKTIMGILRRNKLLKAFKNDDPKKPDPEKIEGEKVLKAYSNLVDKKKSG
jgi:centrin-1